MKTKLIFLLGMFLIVSGIRIIPEHLIIGRPDIHGCVIPFKYCNFTHSCEPIGNLCVL